jgi:hypothetical protein
MTPADFDETLVAERLTDATRVMTEFRGSDASLAAVRLLDALVTSYVGDLMNCKPEQLAHYQAATQQALQLRRVLMGDFVSPRI